MVDGGPSKPWEGEVFAVLEVLRSNGEMLAELASDLWTLRTDLVRAWHPALPYAHAHTAATSPQPRATSLWPACLHHSPPPPPPPPPPVQVWGAFWSVPMPPATGAVRFCLHRSLVFTEPLLGCVELPLHELTQDGLCTQWHPLRAKEQRGGDILGEVAVQQSNSSIATPASRHAHLRAALPRRCCSRYGGTARRLRSALRPTSAWARRRRRRTSSRTRASSTLRSTGRRPWPPSTSPVSQG